EGAGALERGVGVAADPDRDPARLCGFRQRMDLADPVVFALERDGIGSPGRAHEPQVFVGHLAARLERGSRERLELLPEPPDARAAIRRTTSGLASGPRAGRAKPNSTTILREKCTPRSGRRLWYH